MDQKDINDARASLREFMLAMNTWETSFYRSKTDALENNESTVEIDKVAREKLKEILERWAVSDKANEGRLIDLGVTDPPTYNPMSDIEESAEIAQGGIHFGLVQSEGLQTRFRFAMKHFADGWKIQKKEFLNFKDKWQRSVL